jgi:hypothetical protein
MLFREIVAGYPENQTEFKYTFWKLLKHVVNIVKIHLPYAQGYIVPSVGNLTGQSCVSTPEPPTDVRLPEECRK